MSDAATVTPGCVLAPVTEVAPKHCVWCGALLAGRQRRWCSKGCVDLFSQNHEWTLARWAAVDRASVVVRWGGSGDEQWPVETWTYCDQCHRRISDYEVNHVEPRVGAGYGKGCWNHQTNLQVLCHACHVVETARQGRERKVVGWPGADPHHTWRDLGWSWAEAERFIDTGEYPARPLSAEPDPGEPMSLWDAA